MLDTSFVGSLLVGFSVILIFYVAGRMVTSIFNHSGLPDTARFFLTVLSGMLSILSFFALYHTRFHSILLIFPVAYLFYSAVFFKKIRTHFNNNLSQIRQNLRIDLRFLLVFAAYFIAFVLVQMFRYSFFQAQPLVFPDHDHSYYLNVAHYATVTGSENSIPWYELFYRDYLTEPYHYADVWLIAFFLKLYPFSDNIYLFTYGFMPFLAALLACGAWGIGDWDKEQSAINNNQAATSSEQSTISSKTIKQFNNLIINPVTNHLVAFLSVFIIGVFPYRIGGYLDNVLYLPKMFPSYLCLITFLIFFSRLKSNQKANREESDYPYLTCALLALLALPVLHILYAPVVLTVICIWLGILFLQKNFKLHLIHFLLPFLTGAYIIGFYYFQGYFSRQASGSFIFEYPQNFFVWFFDTILDNIWLYHLPLLLLIVLSVFAFSKSHLRLMLPLWLLFGLFIGFSWLMAYLLLNSKESFQLIGLLLNPVCFCVFLILYKQFVSLGKLNNFRKVALGIMVVYGFIIFLTPFYKEDLNIRYRHYATASFLKTLQKDLKVKNRIGGFIGHRNKENFFADSPHLGSFFSVFFLQKLGKGYLCLSLVAPDKAPKDFTDIERQALYDRSPFYRFMQTQKTERTFTSVEQCQADFITHFQIEYLIIQNDIPLPLVLQNRVKKEIQDPGSGLRVFLFN